MLATQGYGQGGSLVTQGYPPVGIVAPPPTPGGGGGQLLITIEEALEKKPEVCVIEEIEEVICEPEPEIIDLRPLVLQQLIKDLEAKELEVQAEMQALDQKKESLEVWWEEKCMELNAIHQKIENMKVPFYDMAPLEKLIFIRDNRLFMTIIIQKVMELRLFIRALIWGNETQENQ